MGMNQVPYDVVLFEPSAMFLDFIFEGLPGMPKLGTEIFAKRLTIAPGGIYNTASVLAKLGCKVALVTQIGTDIISRFLERELAASGVDTRYLMRQVGEARAITVSMSFPKDRAFISYEDRPELYKFPIELLDPNRTRCLMFARMPKRPEMIALGRAARAVGVKLVMDMHLPYGTVEQSKVRRILAQADCILPNAVEARIIADARTVAQALPKLAGVTTVVIKDGPHGALTMLDGKPFRQKGVKVRAVDTTGAGDCFNAGFLTGWLSGLSMPESMARGNACASFAVQKAGATTGAPSPDELDGLLKREYGYRFHL
jgi:sugar/nucleoside kinase (ribokinase family)